MTSTSGKENSLTRSVVANWIGHFFFIVSGFILPRIINDHIGQASLGIWDFGWSTVAWFSLLNAGIISSVNRYVARFSSIGDWEELNGVASACACIFFTTGTITFLASIALSAALPSILPGKFADLVVEAQWVVLFLGTASAVEMPMSVYNGVITGYRRYDLTMLIETGFLLAAATAIFVEVLTGYGLKLMSVTYLACKIMEGVLKYIAAHRVCPQLHLSPRRITRQRLREVVHFGGKTFFGQIAKMITFQGNALLVGYFLGPASLAVLSRSFALANHAEKALFQFSRVLAPSASAVQARQNEKELSDLIMMGSRYSILLALPLVLTLAVLDDPLMRVWMGSQYANLPLLTILSICQFASLAQSGPSQILLGLNRHGLPGLVGIFAAVLSLVATAVMLGVMNLGLVAVVFSVGVSVSLVNIFVTPVVIARVCGLSLREYIMRTFPGALLAVTPYAAWLIFCRLALVPRDVLALVAGVGVGGVILMLSYWRSYLPASIKSRILGLVGVLGLRGQRP